MFSFTFNKNNFKFNVNKNFSNKNAGKLFGPDRGVLIM